MEGNSGNTEMMPDVVESTRCNKPAKDVQDVERKLENFVFLVIQNALGKCEANRKEGHVRGSKKPPKNTSLVEGVGAIIGGAVGSSIGFIGTGAATGAALTKFIFEQIFGYCHRKKAKAIAKIIEDFSIDDSQILSMFASIGAEIFRVFENQLSACDVTDLEKVAHDVVVRVYIAIADDRSIWLKDEYERSALLARSATKKGSSIYKISKGHSLRSIENGKTKGLLSKVGIYDDGKYFVKNNTDSRKYNFRRLFKNEVIDMTIWHLANPHQIGSFQTQFYVTEDMIARVIPNAISRIKDADLPMASKQSAVFAAEARDALKEYKTLNHEHHAQFVKDSKQLETEKAQVDGLVTSNQEMNSFLSNIQLDASTKQENAAKLEESMRTIYERDAEYQTLIQSAMSEYEGLSKDIASLAEDQKGKAKIEKPLDTDAPDMCYIERDEEYAKLKEFCDNHPAGILDSAIFTVIVGETGVGKSELARSLARNEFKGKQVLWIEATNQESREESFIRIAAEINGIEEDKNTKDITVVQKELYSRLDPDRTLVVFDGVYEFDDIISHMPFSILPQNRSPNVLVTSNNKKDHWEEVKGYHFCEIIELKPFNEKECIHFFNSLPYDEMKIGLKDETIIELGKELGFLPRALVEAVNDILEKECTVTDYLNSIRHTSGSLPE